ncbi:hypothetical protein GOTRE_133_00210 [Gordonia terrae NBRC 100016]|uniref:Uncharacterized protein n=2 Tax=Gordonia terrae TaxID=2055 RepID=A0ABQ0HIV3_9ACTN|nr:hypothetical protein BCM27_06305 [Gordonia terrae]GAB45833.1 hypothetical protein GOTRE_133_00210 [Gordonia terrae NBRC 100016]
MGGPAARALASRMDVNESLRSPEAMDVRVLSVMLPVVLLFASCAAHDSRQSVQAQMLGESGYGFVSDSVGLSIESSTLAGDGKAIQRQDLVSLFKDFRPGMVLRVGGNTSDQMFWTSAGEPRPSGYRFTVTPKGLNRLAELTKELGWRVVMGVNLRARDPQRAADMARYARSIFGEWLTAIAIGNEPNVYYPSNPPFGTYASDVRRYGNEIRAAVPDVSIQGPDASGNRSDFIWSSASQFARSPAIAPDVYAAHFYGSQGCDTETMRPSALFTEFADERRKSSLTDIYRASSLSNSPKAVLSEVNSINCGGMAGISNRLAGALWMLDFAFYAATQGFNGVYFHGTLTDCIAYSPVCVADDREINTADPFKALLLLNRMANGMAMLSVAPYGANSNIRLYGLRGRNSLALVAINTGEGDGDWVDVNVDLPGSGFAELASAELFTKDETSTDGTRLARMTSMDGMPPDLDKECASGQIDIEPVATARVASRPASAKVVFFCERND